MDNKIKERQEKEKSLIVEELSKIPIIEIACKKIGIARSTFYRWRKENKEFAKQTDNSIISGSQLINDMAESQLISAIKDRNLTAIIFWLKNHHRIYADKMELTAKIEEDEKLTPEQKNVVEQALKLASFKNNDALYEKTIDTNKQSKNNSTNDSGSEDKDSDD